MKSIPIRNIHTSGSHPGTDSLKIRTLETLLDGNNLHHALHRHNYYYMLLITKAKGAHEIDFTSYNLKGGRIFLLKPGQVHQLTIKKGGTGYIIQFSNELIHDLNASQMQTLRSVFHSSVNDLTQTQTDRLKAIFEMMLDEFTARKNHYVEIIKSHLLTSILYLSRAIEGNRTISSSNLYSQQKLESLHYLLEKHIVKLKKTADYAKLLHLSEYQLNSITKLLLGKNCSEVINEFVILEAKRQLLATTNQISQIADALGFDDPAYFIRFFKKHTGVTPDAMRKTSR